MGLIESSRLACRRLLPVLSSNWCPLHLLLLLMLVPALFCSVFDVFGIWTGFASFLLQFCARRCRALCPSDRKLRTLYLRSKLFSSVSIFSASM